MQYRGWKQLRNGALLRAIAAAGDVDVFVTADHHLRHQQNLAALPFAIVVLRPRRKVLDHLVALMPDVRRLLPTLRPGTLVGVHPPDARRPDQAGERV